MIRILCVYRAERFSPNSVDRDKAIMDAVRAQLESRGCVVETINEERLTAGINADVVLTMARSREALDLLKAAGACGCTVVNRTEGIERCARSTVDALMRTAGLPAAPLEGPDGYWIKRGDEAAQSKADVVYAAGAAERDAAIEQLRRRGITETVVTAHVKGDLVKFYGFAGTDFFRTFYPAEGTYSKFGDETVNGRPCHYAFSEDSLRRDAGRLAALTGVDVYGGDCIVRSDGTYAIIDFNDWPSFASCRQEAAVAIADMILRKVKG